MSDIAVRVEHLSKRYKIGGPQNSYRTLRESLVSAAGAPLRWLRGERRRDEQIWALDDISFEVKHGEALGIIGRNGAGKSTLLKILSRITKPTHGRVELNGRVSSLLEVGTGFHPELTGRENIYLNAAILGMKRAEIDRKFDEIVDFSEIEKFLDTPVKYYSSGMYVRLAFAVAAHLEPEILVVDEVLAVGDARFQKKCLGKMSDVAHEGRTVLFVSHNLGTISRLCSKSILLDKGHLICFDNTSNVIKSYIEAGQDYLTEYVKPNDPSKAITLRAVRICDKDWVLLANPEVKYDTEIGLEIEYEVNQTCDNCTVWIGLESLDGTMVFTTTDYDKDPQMLKLRTPGRYKARVIIPGKWLNYGRYLVIVGIVQNAPLVVFNRDETLIFSVLEIDSPSALFQSGTRRGVLQPILDWDTKRI
jgi:lipopolysaccharide transport system ATP-binding protein